MDKKKFFAIVCTVAFILLAGLVKAEAKSKLVIEKGTDDWQIVISTEASLSEKHGASELQKFLKEISGAELPIVTDDKAMSRHEIILGDNAHLRKLNVKIDFEKLGSEGFTIRTMGRHLIIAGGRARGTMYGVYTFLEDHLGCRWFVPDAGNEDHQQSEALGKAGYDVVIPGIRYIPRLKRIEIGEINDTQAPAFEYRGTFPYRNIDWNVRHKFNGGNFHIPESKGGYIYIVGGHSFYRLLPPEKYFKDHPEYFSEINGRRTAEKAQLCLSNPEVVKIVTENLKRLIREKPKYNAYHVSQMDWANYCQCPKCQAIDEREGSPMGSILSFVNKVAEGIEPEFPDKYVETFSYSYSQKPPRTIRPRKNVIVMLAPIQACYSHPIAVCDGNLATKQDIEGWAKLIGPGTGKLYVHMYNGNAYGFLPQPSFNAMQPNVQFLRDNNVSGIFGFGVTILPEQQLRSYILAKLYWNPDVDVEKVTNEFLTAVYGKAAPLIGQYRQLLEQKVLKDNIHCGIGTSPIDWLPDSSNSSPASAYLTPEVLEKAEKLFDQAEKLVANDADALLRVQAVRQEINYYKIYALPFGDPQRPQLVEQFVDVAKRAGLYWLGERKRLNADFIAELKRAGVIDIEKLTNMGDNILRNADFEQWVAENLAPDGWLLGGGGPLVLMEKQDAKEGQYCLKLTNYKGGHTFVDQRVPVDSYTGKIVIFGAWVKAAPGMDANLSIMDWVGRDNKYASSASYTGGGQWQFLVARKFIRKDATGDIWFRLNGFNSAPESEPAVCFDGAIAVVVE